jgi:hypothetical protein
MDNIHLFPQSVSIYFNYRIARQVPLDYFERIFNFLHLSSLYYCPQLSSGNAGLAVRLVLPLNVNQFAVPVHALGLDNGKRGLTVLAHALPETREVE